MQTFVVLVTCSSRSEADTIAEAVIAEQLAACVNILPGIESVYRWEGAVQKGQELLLLIKTTEERLTALEDRVKAIHSYTVPEFVALPIVAGSTDYLDWVQKSVGS